MIIGRTMRALLAGSALLLAACTTNTHPIGMTIAPSGQVLSGALNVGSGAQGVTLTSDDGQLACNGVSLLEYATPGCRTSGSLRLQCTDGRDVTGNWKMNDCASGQGSGTDDRGNAVTFHVGTGSGNIDAARSPAPAPRAAHRPAITHDAGSHLFRFGGDYAAGFGEARQFAYEAVFTDAESGLIIVKLGAQDDLPMSLADVPLAPGQEAFVVMPDSARIERILIAGEDPKWATGNGMSLRAGLPVMNFNGEVIALTNGGRLVDARSLRRYLQLFAPSLADQPATRSTAEELRERIMTRHVD